MTRFHIIVVMEGALMKLILLLILILCQWLQKDNNLNL
uniref:Uncharacterized protein n=1 Tax=Arundo donax TaxID=35708 RepID=A0A0A9BFY8_ARUDO